VPKERAAIIHGSCDKFKIGNHRATTKDSENYENPDKISIALFAWHMMLRTLHGSGMNEYVTAIRVIDQTKKQKKPSTMLNDNYNISDAQEV